MAVGEFQETLSVTAEEVRLMNAYWRAVHSIMCNRQYVTWQLRSCEARPL